MGQATPFFERFGTAHLSILAVTFLLPFFLVWLRRLLGRKCLFGRGGGAVFVIGLVLAVILVGNKLFTLWLAWKSGRLDGTNFLPLHLCDIATLLAVWALLRDGRTACELTFFWGLAGTMQALFTPDLRHGFPSPFFFIFFISHGGIVAVAIYLGAVSPFKLTAGSVWRAWALLHGYAMLAGLANFFMGSNYGYLAAKPSSASLMDFLGPWPFYLAVLSAVALASFWFYYGCYRAAVLIKNKFFSAGSYFV